MAIFEKGGFMRKTALIVLALVAVVALRGFAFAFPVSDDFKVFITDTPYTGGNWWNYVDKSYTEFLQTQTPYLFMHIPASQTVETYKSSWWSPTAATPQFVDIGPDGSHDLTLTLDWLSVPKTPGPWSVDGIYSDFENPDVMKTTGFSFVPEPISASLFLLGGGALAVIRKKKQA
jgi:hypothetical protein